MDCHLGLVLLAVPEMVDFFDCSYKLSQILAFRANACRVPWLEHLRELLILRFQINLQLRGRS